MRIVGSIPHHDYKITVFYMNERYSVKIEDGYYEQWFKFRPMGDALSLDLISSLIDERFLVGVQSRFKGMHADWMDTQAAQLPNLGKVDESWPEIV